MADKVHRIHSLPGDSPWQGGLPPTGSEEHPLTIRALDRVLAIQRPVVLAHLRSIRLRHPEASSAEIVRILERRYLAAVTTGGAAVGATAVVPGIGTGVTLALSGVETVAFLEATTLFAQSVAEVHGIPVADPGRARALVLTLMLGKEGVDLVAQLGQSRAEAVGSVVDAVEPAQRARRASARGRGHVHDLGELVVVDHREVERDLPRVLGSRRKQVALGPERVRERGDDLLADRVQRRVRDLRELLREVVEEQARALAQHGDRGVRSHRAEWLGTGLAHGREEDAHFLLGVAEGALTTRDRGDGVHDVLALGQVRQTHPPGIQPFLPGMQGREVALDLVVLDDAPRRGVDQIVRVLDAFGDALERQRGAEVKVGEEGVQLLVGDVGVDGHDRAGMRERGRPVKST